MAKTTNTKTKKRAVARRKKAWTPEEEKIALLLENELKGLLDYLHTLSIIAVILFVSSVGGFMYGLQMLFEEHERAVIAFLLVVATTFVTSIFSALALKPWPLPRFLLPMDLHDITVKDLSGMIVSPKEYIHSIAEHIQIVTEKYLLARLHRLRNAITILLFGLSTAIILAITLP